MIIIFFGLPGSGKTFLAKKFANQLDVATIHIDQLRAELQKRGNYNPENKQFVYKMMFEEANSLLQQQKNVMLDATFTASENRAQANALAKKWQQPIYFILTIASEAKTRERTEKPRADSEADFSVYLKLKEKFNPAEVPHLTIDTTDEETLTYIQQIIQYIQE